MTTSTFSSLYVLIRLNFLSFHLSTLCCAIFSVYMMSVFFVVLFLSVSSYVFEKCECLVFAIAIEAVFGVGSTFVA